MCQCSGLRRPLRLRLRSRSHCAFRHPPTHSPRSPLTARSPHLHHGCRSKPPPHLPPRAAAPILVAVTWRLQHLPHGETLSVLMPPLRDGSVHLDGGRVVEPVVHAFPALTVPAGSYLAVVDHDGGWQLGAYGPDGVLLEVRDGVGSSAKWYRNSWSGTRMQAAGTASGQPTGTCPFTAPQHCWPGLAYWPSGGRITGLPLSLRR